MHTLIAEQEQKPLKDFTEKAYLDYSMYVILDRALPSITDGLKPVQRRIVYAMSELGLKNTAKYKKSTRTVGDVLGKYHPHGDSACYEAMVLMAQPFSYRYPLVDGQGNWGSTDDPKSFAAMRYTEAKLSGYADTLLSELGQGTVEWGDNFDGTLEEPRFLPARLPNLLLNGTTGIAVGMATDVPAHNLTEVANACVYLLDNPHATLDDIVSFIPAPDLPTAAEIITPPAALKEMYATGYGSFRMRAVYTREDSDIVITALPHQVSGAKILEQIAEQMQAKKLPMVVDLRDESDLEHPTRLVIVPRSNRVDVDSLMNHLFATTDLEKSYRVNLNVIGLNQKPQVKSLLQILSEWITFRLMTVKRRLEHRLDKVEKRLHILAGLLIAFLNIDEVIHIIRTEDDPKAALIAKFGLSELQAEAILEIKLRQLAKLEEVQIRAEESELSKERDSLQQTIASERRLKTLVKKEIEQDRDRFGDKRYSPIVDRAPAQAIRESDLVAAEPVTIILSEKGWIRSAKGFDVDVTKLSYKSGDSFLASCAGKSNQQVITLDNTGRSYSFSAADLPSARGFGEPLTSRLSPPAEARFISLLMGNDATNHVLLASNNGYGFITTIEELYAKNKNGKAILSVADGAEALPPLVVHSPETDQIAVVTNAGYLLVFPVKELPMLTKGKGNKLIQLSKKGEPECIVALRVFDMNQTLRLHSDKRYLSVKAADLKHYFGQRARRGTKLPRGFQRIQVIEVLGERGQGLETTETAEQ